MKQWSIVGEKYILIILLLKCRVCALMRKKSNQLLSGWNNEKYKGKQWPIYLKSWMFALSDWPTRKYFTQDSKHIIDLKLVCA